MDRAKLAFLAFFCFAAVTAAANTPDWETFAFVLKSSPSVWTKFDWEKLTTICVVGFFDRDLIRHAQGNGVKVVSIGNIEKGKLADKYYRSKWVKAKVTEALQYGLNGTNVDFEKDLEAGSAEAGGYTALMKEGGRKRKKKSHPLNGARKSEIKSDRRPLEP
jgi:hypothetical protein